MKYLRSFSVILTLIFVCFVGGCSNNRPDFITGSNSDTNTSVDAQPENNVNSEAAYQYITIRDGVSIAASSLSFEDGAYKVPTGTLIKIGIDTSLFNIAELTYVNGETFYFDSLDNTIITGVKINGFALDIHELDDYITVNYDMVLEPIKSSVNLRAVMFCHQYSINDDDATYTKFNYKSDNFRNSLVAANGENIAIDDCERRITYVIFDSNKNVSSTNVSHSIKLNANEISLAVEVFSAINTAIAFVYEDKNHNCFISSVSHCNEYSTSKKNIVTTTFTTMDPDYTTLTLNLTTYFLPQ